MSGEYGGCCVVFWLEYVTKSTRCLPVVVQNPSEVFPKSGRFLWADPSEVFPNFSLGWLKEVVAQHF